TVMAGELLRWMTESTMSVLSPEVVITVDIGVPVPPAPLVESIGDACSIPLRWRMEYPCASLLAVLGQVTTTFEAVAVGAAQYQISERHVEPLVRVCAFASVH